MWGFECSYKTGIRAPDPSAEQSLVLGLGNSDFTHTARYADRTFELRSLPFASLRCRSVGAGKKVEQQGIWVSCGAYRVVREDELSERRFVGGARGHR